MAKYIVQHRRGTATQWADKSTIIPKEGELVIEIDEANSLHKLKIGDGKHTYSELAYLQAGDEIVTQVLTQAKPRIITVTLTDNWNEITKGKYGQDIELDDITTHSRLDLQPDVDMIEEFKQLGLVFVTENNGGVITVYSVGNMPLKSYTMQATIVEAEVVADCDKIIGMPIGASTAKVANLEDGAGEGSIQQIGSSAEGIYTYAGGDGSSALSYASYAHGKQVSSGAKGFRLISGTGIEGGSGTYTLDGTEGIEVDDIYSIHDSSYLPQHGKITAINGNTITVDNFYPLNLKSEEDLAIEPWRNMLFIDAKPEIGTIEGGYGAHAEGVNTKALKTGAHAEGSSTEAIGIFSHTEGRRTKAIGSVAHAEGYQTQAIADTSHTEGHGTIARGYQAHAEGATTQANGINAHSEGNSTIANGENSHAEGFKTLAQGYGAHTEGISSNCVDLTNKTTEEITELWNSTKFTMAGYGSHAEGVDTIAIGYAAHSEGQGTMAKATASHSEGAGTIAKGVASHAEGEGTQAIGQASHTEGSNTVASIAFSHAEGEASIASGHSSHAENKSKALGMYSHAEGLNWGEGKGAAGNCSHVEGENNYASNTGSHAEGKTTTSSGEASHSEGIGTTASGAGSHAEGQSTKATTGCAHAEGQAAEATGWAAHAEGAVTKAKGAFSHAEGRESTASGQDSHAQGYKTQAIGNASFATGEGTIAKRNNQTAVGQYNEEDDSALFVVGVGSAGARKSMFKVDASGASVKDSNNNWTNILGVINQAFSALNSLSNQITALEARIEELEKA